MLRRVCRSIAILLVAGVSAPALAEKKADPCDDGRGDGILRCSENRLAEAKREMAKTLASLRKAIDHRQLKDLNASQKHWLRYANSYCSVAGNPYPDSPNSFSGQIYWNDASYNYCHKRLTEERNANLARILDCRTGGGSESCS